MANERASLLADDFAAANAEAIAFAQSCSAAEWVVPVPGEGWSVGVVLHHIAEGHSHAYYWLRAMTSGEGVADSAQDIDRANAEHAVRAATVGSAKTAALLQENGERLESLLRELNDRELDQEAPFGPAGGRSVPTADLAPVPARHTREHLAHARIAVARG